MASKTNCWEFKSCGRQPGGANVAHLGECTAATDSRGNGVHGGTNSGRACWAVAGTLCGGKVQGTYAAKLGECLRCDFFQDVMAVEGASLLSHSQLHALFE